MKPPSTVEARVAEELRNWLSSELEQLNASNTNQFAHHVVTILLHEDLDIEDEPLTTGDDFLHDIYSIRRGKTRDKQKKAAVQFLRSAVCCNDPGEAEIQGVVDELMVKIEETKIKMNSKSSPKRMSVDVHNSLNQSRRKTDSDDTERLYNEAFPSLHSNNNSLTGHRPGVDTARSRQPSYRAHTFDSLEEAHACHTARQVFLSALAESVLPSFEATEILPSDWMDSSIWESVNDAYSCWYMPSAFQTCTLLNKFVPSVSPLKSPNQSDTRSRYLREFSPIVIPVINQSDLQSVHLHPSYEKTLTEHPQLFRPIKERSDCYATPQSETDIEVDSIVNASQHKDKQGKKVFGKHQTLAVSKADFGDCESMDLNTVSFGSPHSRVDEAVVSKSVLYVLRDRDNMNNRLDIAQGERCLELEKATQSDSIRTCSPENNRDVKFLPQHLWETSDKVESCGTCNCEIDEVCSFPEHYGGFWNLLTNAGSMALYPVVTNQLVFDLGDRLENCHSIHTSYQSLSDRHSEQKATCENSTDNFTEYLETSWEHEFHHSMPDVASGQYLLERACIEVKYYYAIQQIARIQQEHSSHLQQASLHDLFVPSLLGSYLSHEGSQLLQRAFVNTYFSNLFKEPVYKTLDRVSGISCSDLEHCWLSTEILPVSGLGQVVPGCTCSSWLENNCHLGDSCPFSHPSL